jgi:hypothetical protein
MEDEIWVPEENRTIVIVGDDFEIEIPGEVCVIEVQEDGTAR